jgi:tetratricopeptide (TPR) repeat protein
MSDRPAMSDPKVAIALIASSADPKIFGTGFVVHQDEAFSYLVTCAHVVRDIEKVNGETGKLLAEDSVATVVVRGDCDAIDLAVLRVDRWYRRSPVALSIAVAADRPVEIVGHREYSGTRGAWERPITGKLERPLRQKLNGQVIPAWDLLLPPDELQPGYSGSPVIDRETGTVVAVTNIQRGKERGIAIGIEALATIWPEMPPGLIEAVGAGSPRPDDGDSDGRPAGRLVGREFLPAVPVWAGRDRLMAELGPLLRAGEALRVVALIGQGGIGKSALAAKLLESIGVELASGLLSAAFLGRGFGRAIAFKAFEGTSFDEVAAGLLAGLGAPDGRSLVKPTDKIAAIVRALAEEPALVVLDNLESVLHPASHERAGRAIEPDWGELLTALANGNHRSLVLLTSREYPRDLVGKMNPLGLPDPLLVKLVDLRAVDGASSLEILQNYGFTDQSERQWIADRVQGQPFLLRLLAGYAQYPGYVQQHPELLAGGAEQLLKQQLARQSKAARQLLQKMCVLRVPVNTNALTFLRLYKNNFLTQDLRFLWSRLAKQKVEFGSTEIKETQTILEALSNASLIQKQYDSERREFLFDLHRVVVEFLQRELGEAKGALLQSVYRFYCTGKTLNNPQTIEELQPLLEAQHFAFQLGNYSEAENLIYQLEDYLEPWGYWTLLKELFEQVLPHLDRASQPYILQRIGSRYRDWGDWDKAETLYQQALDLARTAQNKSLTAGLTGQLGNIERNRGNWDAAESLYRQCLAVETELGDRAGMASSWGLLGDIERNRGNWDAAESLYRQMLEVFTELGDRAGMASSWGLLGGIERNRGNWDAAESLFRQSLELRTELGDRAGMASSWGVLGDIERNRGNWDAAESLYRQCLAVETELGDRAGMASSWASLGSIERNRGNWDAAESLYRQCLAVETELGDRAGMASSWGVLGDIERNRGNWDAAESLYRQSLELRTELGDRYKIAEAKGDFGELELDRGDLDKAEALLTEALQTFEAMQAIAQIAYVEFRLAQVWQKRGDLTRAEPHRTRARDIYQQLGAAKDLERIETEWQTGKTT